MSETYVGIDTGGTNIRAYLVNPDNGEIDLENPLVKTKASDISSNKELTELLYEKIKTLGSSGKVKIGSVSAGLIDKKRKVIVSSPNFKSFKGEITYPKDLAEIGYDVTIANDMEGGAMGIVFYGPGKGLEKGLVATYSSGHNYAVWEDNHIRLMQIEAGHKHYRKNSGIFCGCSGEGHLEPYVSGNGASGMAVQFLFMQGIPHHTILEETLRKKSGEINLGDIERLKTDGEFRKKALFKISSREVYAAYKRNPGENPQKTIRNLQVEAIADSISFMMSDNASLDLMVFMGSQTKDWDLLFEPAKKMIEENPEDYHLPALKLPKIIKNEIKKIGVRGAVAYHVHQRAVSPTGFNHYPINGNEQQDSSQIPL